MVNIGGVGRANIHLGAAARELPSSSIGALRGLTAADGYGASVVVADFNGDGSDDIAVISSGNYSLNIPSRALIYAGTESSSFDSTPEAILDLSLLR